jgi:hypothetical protein
MIGMKYTMILIPVLSEGVMGKICPINLENVLEGLNPGSSKITYYPARYGI